MSFPIADFLPVFSPTGSTAPALPAPALADVLGREAPTGLSEDEVEQRIADARAEILTEAAAALETSLAEQASELAARYDEALAHERRLWAEAQSVRLGDALARAFDELEGKLADSVVHVIEPFVEAAIRAEAAAGLRQAVADLLANGAGARIRVSGPADLVEPLRAAFAERAGLQVEVADAADVTVEADDTTIRSQLGPWAERLRAAMDEAGR